MNETTRRMRRRKKKSDKIRHDSLSFDGLLMTVSKQETSPLAIWSIIWRCALTTFQFNKYHTNSVEKIFLKPKKSGLFGTFLYYTFFNIWFWSFERFSNRAWLTLDSLSKEGCRIIFSMNKYHLASTSEIDQNLPNMDFMAMGLSVWHTPMHPARRKNTMHSGWKLTWKISFQKNCEQSELSSFSINFQIEEK